MSESGPTSEDESHSGYSDSYDDSEFSGDDSYNYTGEESYEEESCAEEERGVSLSPHVAPLVQQDEWQYCEQVGEAPWPPQRKEAPQVYAPDRGPPLLDFLFVLTAFFAAGFAAYYTIFTEEIL